MRLMQLLDRDAFPDESSVTQRAGRPFVIRTEKRVAIDAEGKPLFKPRMTRLQAVAWQDRACARSSSLYEAVTDYVRHGYNQAHGGEAAAHRLPDDPDAAAGDLQHGGHPHDAGEAAGAAGSAAAAAIVVRDGRRWTNGPSWTARTRWISPCRRSGLGRMEKAEVELLLDLARETEAQGTDAKAEALLELIYKLQQEENDPELKVLIFTEFVPTQAMLADFLESRGFSVATAERQHGSGSARQGAAGVLARRAQS